MIMAEQAAQPPRFISFADFYPYYLSEHQNTVCKRLHFIGSVCALGLAVRAILSLDATYLLAALFSGYAFAWVGHFYFEKNRPATFKNPFYSFAADWVMFKDVLVGKIPF
jgi:hypothetical protein